MFDPAASPFAPLPGTRPAPRALFVDRWGTLLEVPEAGHAAATDDVCFLPGAVESLYRASRAGWKIYLLGNEDAVAYGHVSPDAWHAIEAFILAHLLDSGVPVVRPYTCISRPDGIEGQVGDSVYQLPNTGAFYHAAHEDGIDLGRSWVIGDSTLELVAGWRSGCRTAAVRTGLALADCTFEVDPELFGDSLVDVIAVLINQASLSA